jgi:hypothetical protein
MTWAKDITCMHYLYKMQKPVDEMSRETLRQFLNFRVNFIQEELDELKSATESGKPIDAEETVDALIDICVVAIGTLDLFDVDADKAWKEVLCANLQKEPGKKEGRDNPLGLPDLKKPKNWSAPDHTGNHGKFGRL